MKKIMLFVFLMNTLGLYSQNITNVCIVDENGMSIPYVHIRLSISDGLISNANGCFTLNKNIDRDSLVYISHIAFEPIQLTIGSIGDTIHLVSKVYSINEVVFSQVNIYKLLTNAFKPVSYDAKRNYCSTRLFATGDSLVYYSEELFKLTKFDEKKMIMKRKLIGAIYYNASTKDSNYIRFPISSSIRNNPYWFYSSETNLLPLIKIASIEKQYENFYQVKAKTDSSEITMYVSKENGRLLRFEKTITPHKQKNVHIGETSYSYDFEIGKNNIIIHYCPTKRFQLKR
ncbi:hypothetical protein [Williamwhitmania taraxaci]|uniref:CarboxypepD_reg-like domain-containing protein n=1 Tax=Williamwhitmania taraxaci TaxID=1640674 RepID=A0A1G6QW20_9BACT|nr:hypothetical protein [Williamwhitmania taraxaci]SDC95866.1 hypothetical protein SAMN05216323_10662 [Williamwhitmania taraxaci]